MSHVSLGWVQGHGIGMFVMVTIHERVQAVRTRLQKQWAWQCLSWGMVGGGLAGCILGLGRYLSSGSISWSWIGAAIIAGPVAGAAIAWLKSYSTRNAAMTIDRVCHFKDRTETALRFLSDHQDSVAHRSQIADAETHMLSVDPMKVVPIKTPRPWVYGMALSVCAVVLAFLSNPSKEAVASAVRNEVVFNQAARVEESVEELKKLQEEQQNPELEKLLKEIAAKVEELKQPGLDPKEALAKLSEMEASMQDLQKQLSDPKNESQLQEVGKALSLAESLAAAGQALSKGEMDKAAEELAKLEMPELDRKTEKAITEKLEEIKKNCECNGAPKQLKESVASACQGLSQGDKSKFKDAMDGLASECKKCGTRKKLSDLLRKQCQCMCECKGECEKECKSQCESNKIGGKKAGLARSGNDPGDKTAKLKTNPQMNITGQESAQGDVDVETEAAPEQEQEAVRQYRQNAEKYEALSESVLETESIPLGHRQTIRKYFEMIRPQNEK